MKTLKWETVPPCDLCKAQNDIVYDVPLKHGSWAHVCESCMKIHGGNVNIGSKIVKIKPKPAKVHSVTEIRKHEIEFISSFSDDDIEDLVMDSIVPTICPEGCEVEPDGKCPHGYSSVLLLLGLI